MTATDPNVLNAKNSTGQGPYEFPLLDKNSYGARVSFQAVEIIPEVELGADFNIQDTFAELARSATNLSRQSEVTEQQQRRVANSASGAGDEGFGYIDNSGLDDFGISSDLANAEDYAGSNSFSVNPMKINILDGERCNIYMPVAMVFQDMIGYDNTELGASGATTLGLMQQGSSLTGAVGAGISAGFSGISDLFGKLPTGELARLAAARAANVLPGGDLSSGLKNAIGVAARVIVNPNTRAMFRNVALREFTFQFKFIAKSQDEAEMVEKMIRFFRFHAYPEHINVGGIPVGYVFPNLFKIKMQYQTQGGGYVQIGNRIKMSYLRSVSTTYNPSSMTFHPDGRPNEIDMTLSFVEHRTLHRGDILSNGSTTGGLSAGELLDVGGGF